VGPAGICPEFAPDRAEPIAIEIDADRGNGAN
jgi:hypothetical protein